MNTSTQKKSPPAVLRFLKKMPFLIALCWLVLITIAVTAVIFPMSEAYDPFSQNLRARFERPVFLGGTSEYLLGTDHLGRDLLSRLVFGIRTSLVVALIGSVIGVTVGVGLGLISGMVGGKVESLIMFLVDVQLSIPFTLIALLAITLFGSDQLIFVVIIGMSAWHTYSRLVRGQILTVKGLEFVEAAEALGVSRLRIAFKHVFPNITSPIIVLLTFNLSAIIQLESALSFLGLGIQPPSASLGLLISVGRDHLMSAWWISIIPAAVLAIISLSTSLMGDWLRDVLDPQLRGS